MMKVKPTRIFLTLSALCGVLLLSAQPALAFELFARRLAPAAAQTGDVHQKGDACQKGACQKGACQKGGDACQKGACQKGGDACQKGACQKGPHQKVRLWGAHQKGAVQKGGKGKGSLGGYGDGFESVPNSGAPVPAPISSPTSA